MNILYTYIYDMLLFLVDESSVHLCVNMKYIYTYYDIIYIC